MLDSLWMGGWVGGWEGGAYMEGVGTLALPLVMHILACGWVDGWVGGWVGGWVSFFFCVLQVGR